MTEVRLIRSGNSLVFTVPKAIADQVNAAEGTKFNMVVDVPREILRFKRLSY